MSHYETPREAAFSVAIDALRQHYEEYLPTRGTRRANAHLSAVSRLHDRLLRQSGMDGVALDFGSDQIRH
jgi:hypothetical protein